MKTTWGGKEGGRKKEEGGEMKKRGRKGHLKMLTIPSFWATFEQRARGQVYRYRVNYKKKRGEKVRGRNTG